MVSNINGLPDWPNIRLKDVESSQMVPMMFKDTPSNMGEEIIHSNQSNAPYHYSNYQEQANQSNDDKPEVQINMTYSSGVNKPNGTVLSEDFIVTPSNDTNIVLQMKKSEKDENEMNEEQVTSPLFIKFTKSNDIHTSNTGNVRSQRPEQIESFLSSLKPGT